MNEKQTLKDLCYRLKTESFRIIDPYFTYRLLFTHFFALCKSNFHIHTAYLLELKEVRWRAVRQVKFAGVGRINAWFNSLNQNASIQSTLSEE